MQNSERSTRSTRRFVPEQKPPSDTESQSSPSDTGQYLCIECSETFDTRLELNSHRQCHVTKKQFTCMHCGRGFHHQVFLQMHEQSHEDGISRAPVKTAARVISTRSSKTSDVVTVKPTYTKPQRSLNSTVEFKKVQKVCQAITPKECITRRTRGASSPTFQSSDGQEKDHFELRISKLSETTVQLIDPFGNSIELLTNVFNTYTIGETEHESTEEDNLNTSVGEALTGTSVNSPSQAVNAADMELSGKINTVLDSKNPVEEAAGAPRTESSEPTELISNTDGETPEKLSTEDVVPPLPAPTLLESASTPEEELESQPSSDIHKTSVEETLQLADVPSSDIHKTSVEETLQLADVPQKDSLSEDSGKTVNLTVPSNVCVPAEDQMDTSPENNEMPSTSPASLPELQNETGDLAEIDTHAVNTSSLISLSTTQSATDGNFQETSPSSTPVLAEPRQHETDQPVRNNTPSLKDSALNMSNVYDSEDTQSDEVVTEMVMDVEGNENLTIPETDVQHEEQRVTSNAESLQKSDEPQIETICEPAAVSGSQPESNDELSIKEDGKLDLCSSLLLNRAEANSPAESQSEERSPTKETGDQNSEAQFTLPAASKRSENSNADLAVPSEFELPPASNKDINLEAEAKLCITSKEVGEVSISEGDRNMQVDSKDPEKTVSLLPGQDVLYNDICEKRNVDLFGRDIFQSETPMEVCGKGHNRDPHSTLMVQEKVNDICIDDDNNMTYISESEMIKLLEQDRDDIADNEPITTSLGSAGLSPTEASETFPKPITEPQIGNIAVESVSFLSPVHHAEKQNVDEDHLTSDQQEADRSLQPKGVEEQDNLSKTPILEDTRNEMTSTNSWSPVSLPTSEEPGLADIEPEGPTESLLPQDATAENMSQEQYVITEPSCSGDVPTVTNDILLPERSRLIDHELYEPHKSPAKDLDVCSVGNSALPGIVHHNEETIDVSVTVEDDGKEQTDALELPLLKDELTAVGTDKQHIRSIDLASLSPDTISDMGPQQSEVPECVSDDSSAAPKEMPDHIPFTDHPEEIQNCISNQETDSALQNVHVGQEMKNLSSDILDQSAREAQNDNHATSTGSTEIKVGPTDQQIEHGSNTEREKSRQNRAAETDASAEEQTTDLSSDQLLSSKIPLCPTLSTDLKNEIKEMDLDGNVTLTELQNAELSEMSLAGFDQEKLVTKSITDNVKKPGGISNKAVDNDTVTRVMMDEDSAATRKVLDVIIDQPVCQDNVDISLEDSELMEDEDEEDAENGSAAARPLGIAAECLKCGRRLRRSRKEMTWLSMCFKCRKAERKKRGVDQEVNECSELSRELQQSKKEERLPAEISSSKIKQEQDSLQKDISDDPTTYSDRSPSVGIKMEGPGPVTKKMYKCPKCDKAFKIPALLAGHIRSHTLPQCLTCGGQMHLKYKTRRIPRRCKKCVQKLKEQREEERNAEQSGDEDSGTSDNEELDVSKTEGSEILTEVNMSDDEDSRVRVQKSKRAVQKIGLSDPKNSDGKLLDEAEKHEGEEAESSDELVLPDGDTPRLCQQCGKTFKCNRSLNLHLLSHSAIQCESCGCRLHKKRRVGRWSRKCRACRLQSKSQLFDDNGDQPSLSGDKSLKQKSIASLRLKAKQLHIMKNRKIRSMIKQKKELKLMNMMLAVKGLMNKVKKKKEIASRPVDLEKDEESSEAEICDASSVTESTSIPEDRPKTNLGFPGKKEPGSPELLNLPKKAFGSSLKQGRKCLYTEKNIIKVEENEAVSFDGQTSSFTTPFIKQEETWECLECTLSLPNLETLLSHQQGHIGAQSFTCSQCPQVFSSEQYLNIHIHAHDEERPFRCPECDKTFTKKNHLGVHMRAHSGVRPFACLDCPCRFRQKASLIAHRYSHRNYQLLFVKPYQCSMCTKSFKQRERLVVHERLHTGECPFSCKDCDKVFPSKARLNVHRKMHKISEVSTSNEQNLIGKEVLEGSPFSCKDCGKVCSTKASFVLHRKIHRLSEKSLQQNFEDHPFNCRECNKVFSSKATLAMHLKNHSAHKSAASSGVVPDFQQGFLCKDCGKVCSTKASFVLHRKVHISPSSSEQQILDIKAEPESQVYVCKDCGKVCSTKASFVLHFKVHKSSSSTEQNINIKTEPETQVFICKDCDKVCLTKASLALHCKVHKSPFADDQNLKVKTEPGTQPFICKDCGKVCSTKASFVLHCRVHKSPFADEQKLNIKTEPDALAFVCKDCNKVCSTKASLVLHRKVHKIPGIEPTFKTDPERKTFICKVCRTIFSSKASFILHRKMHKLSSSQQLILKGSTEPRKFKCKHCDMVCSTKASFVLHSRVHKSASVGEQNSKDAEPQSYSCKDCDMVCSTKASFALHSKVHKSSQVCEENIKADVEVNNFTCKECGKVCSTKASFVLHCRMHKSPSSEHNPIPKSSQGAVPAQCKVCGKICSSEGRLRLHSKVHEASLTPDQNSGKEVDTEQPKKTSEKKQFCCATCGLKFDKLKLLLRHKVVHGERTVMPCIHCGKRFLYKKSLFNHVNICLGRNKGNKLLLLKKAAAKRKLLTDGDATGTEEDNEQKKRKIDETKLKNKNLLKVKKAALKKEGCKMKGASDPKTKIPKVKRPKGEGEADTEGEDKKTVTEKQSDVKQEKPAEAAAKQQSGKEKKTTMKVKKPKKVLTKQKPQQVGSGASKKWRVLASTVKKKKLQAVIIGGKKKLLLKKKGIPVKPKTGGKSSKD